MKYIRTKDGICKETDNVKYKEEVVVIPTGKTSFEVNKTIRKITLEPIIKQADTIEELCDEFVICDDAITKYKPYTLPPTFEKLKKQLEPDGCLYGCKDIKGAIWTDKGLIYVAKMNDKGELELL